jgi:hypothetical protein
VKHMLRTKRCLIPDVKRRTLADKLEAYYKRKQEVLTRRRPEKNWYVALLEYYFLDDLHPKDIY